MNKLYIKELELYNFQKHSHLKLNFSENTNAIIGNTDTGKCLTGDTLIPSPIDGKLYSISELMLNPNLWRVWGLNSENLIEEKNIVAIVSNGLKEVYEITTANGRKIKSTFNHRFLSGEGWKELSNFKIGDLIGVNRKVPIIKNLININKEEARILGYLLGDGTIIRSTPGFTNMDENIISDLLYCLKYVCGDLHIKKEKKQKVYQLRFSKPLSDPHRNNTPSKIALLLRKYGIEGLKHNTKIIPKEIYSSSLETIANFLGSLFSCDGYVPKTTKNLEFCSTSKNIIYGFQHLLLRFGISSRIYFTYKTNQSKNKFPAYVLFVSRKEDIDTFFKYIPLYGKKRQLLERRSLIKQNMENSKHYVVPKRVGLIIRERIKNYIARGPFNNKSKNTGRYFAQEIVNLYQLEDLKKEVFNDIYWDKVKEIKYVGIEPTYDVQIDRDQNFIANDFIVHNSCIVRAIKWVFFNEGKDIRKEGTKKTQVIATLNNGAIIEKIRSVSINLYKLTIGEEVKEYNAIGKTIPEEVLKVLQVKPIELENESLILNISQQITLPFLFDKSGSFRMKLFNKLTGNDIIDNIFQELNKDILQIGREEKNQQSNLEELTQSINEVNENISINQKIYDKFSTHYEKTKNCIKQYNELYVLLDNLAQVKSKLSETKEKISSIKLIKEEQIKSLKQKIDKFYNLEKLYESYTQIREDLEEVNISLIDIKIPKINIKELKLKADKFEKISSLQKELKQIKISLQQVDSSLISIQLPTGNITELKTKINKLEILKELQKKYNQIIETKEEIDIKLIESVNLINKKEKEYKKILKDLGVCPLCKQEIK